MSISSLYPTIRPSLLLDFANTQRLDPRITFTRTTTATYYDGVTTAKAEENLVRYSQEFDNAAWPKTNVTVTANTATAPDGTTTAETLTASAGNTSHFLSYNNSFGTVANVPYTASIYVKQGTSQYAIFHLFAANGATSWACVVVDLSTGTITQTSSGSAASGVSSSIVSVGGGWYRVSVTATTNRTDMSTAVSPINTGTPTLPASSYAVIYNWNAVGTETIEIWGAQLEQRSAVSAYTPTTTQPITNYIPTLLTAASGAARFDHNPTTFESLGLLVEEQRTNLVTYSEQFDNAAWTKSVSSITANTIVAPDGALTGDLFIPNTTSGNHAVSRNALTVGTQYTLSVYAKAGGYQYLAVSNAGSSALTAVFDLVNGTRTTGGSVTSASITPVGNGWYRCVLTITAGFAGFSLYVSTLSTNINTFSGDGYSGIFIWGAQLEAGAFPTSYIPTTSATVTRNADVATMTGTNFSSWFNPSQGTLFGDVKMIATTNSGPVAFGISDGSNANAFYGGQTIPTAVRPLGLRYNSTDQAFPSITTTVTNGYEYKFAGSYSFNDVRGASNNVLATADTSAIMPLGVTQASIGALYGATQGLSGTIKKLAYYPTRLTNAQLQALTS